MLASCSVVSLVALDDRKRCERWEKTAKKTSGLKVKVLSRYDFVGAVESRLLDSDGDRYGEERRND